ncbi:hypothetical protein K7W42_20455 [Deinococcus sp. HMF7604]|uniref:hypothetical protein n=1 Tax=Deinococcus betulae TaxID=2873312 RepID=UPI001CCA502E|nr:hypothetical protein [Deinococcus betulae]MBZ9753212.1 hypothetical protein [Deinococcus betulae]
MSNANLDGNAIAEVERLTLEAHQVLESNVRPGSAYLIRDSDGDVKVFRVPTDYRSTTMLDLASLKVMADNEAQLGHLEGLFISNDQIALVSDDGDHDWTSTLKLPQHPLFAYAVAWQKPTAFTQKQLVRLLRTELRDHIEPTLAATFANLKFSNSSEVDSQVRPMSTGLDSRIRQRVAQDNDQDAPETIKLRGPVYDIPEARGDEYEFTVYVEYDHEKGAFLLQTVHGDLRAAQEEAVAGLVKDLTTHAASRYRVFYGLPK